MVKDRHHNTTHGHAGIGKVSPTYRCWLSMRNRCNNVKDKAFAKYGAKGVKVSPVFDSFERFLAEVGPRPLGKTLDRINPFGNYEPGNIRWATITEQNNNRKVHPHVLFQGERFTISNLARKMGMKYNTLYKRVKLGWSIPDAVSTPPQPDHNRVPKNVTSVSTAGLGWLG